MNDEPDTAAADHPTDNVLDIGEPDSDGPVDDDTTTGPLPPALAALLQERSRRIVAQTQLSRSVSETVASLNRFTKLAATVEEINAPYKRLAASLGQSHVPALRRYQELGATMGQAHVSALLTQQNLAASLAPFNTSAHLAAHTRFATLLPTLDTAKLTQITLRQQLPDGAGRTEQLVRAQPPNWPPDRDLERIAVVIGEDGIPLVWVPRASVVAALLAAPDRPARLAVLLQHREEILADCQAVLADVDDPALALQVPLARKALTAMGVGLDEPAQAMAVTLTESAVSTALGTGTDYKKVKKLVRFDPARPFDELRWWGALAPIHRFYTAWWASSGTPPPEALSRHVSVHHAGATHYTRENALLAVMLMTSVLRGLQEWPATATAVAGHETA